MQKIKFFDDWMRLTSATTFLYVESSAVIWLRSMLFLTYGPGQNQEAIRMVIEKFEANIDLATKYATKAPRTPREAALLSVNHYGARVRANRKRLLDRRFAKSLSKPAQ